MAYARDQLRPHDLKVRVEEKISAKDPSDNEGRPVGYFPDFGIIERPVSAPSIFSAETSSLAVAEPILVPRMARATDRTDAADHRFSLWKSDRHNDRDPQSCQQE